MLKSDHADSQALTQHLHFHLVVINISRIKRNVQLEKIFEKIEQLMFIRSA